MNRKKRFLYSKNNGQRKCIWCAWCPEHQKHTENWGKLYARKLICLFGFNLFPISIRLICLEQSFLLGRNHENTTYHKRRNAFVVGHLRWSGTQNTTIVKKELEREGSRGGGDHKTNVYVSDDMWCMSMNSSYGCINLFYIPNKSEYRSNVSLKPFVSCQFS